MSSGAGPILPPVTLFAQRNFHANLKYIRTVVREKKIYKLLSYICLYKKCSPWGGTVYDPRDFICAFLCKVESTCPKDVPYQFKVHSGQWFLIPWGRAVFYPRDLICCNVYLLKDAPY